MADTAANDATIKSATRALRPIVVFLMALYLFAVLDRLNVGFAALTMNKDVGLGPAQFGFGAGLFFLAYVIFEVPSNLFMQRYGPRRWIARVVITWGICSTATALVYSRNSFYLVRILLGLAEAGFFPAVITYISRGFPARERARMNTLFLLGIPLSGVVASFLAAGCLALNGWLGLHGWQWLFICEGAPPIVLGLVVLRYLPDDPSKARFLTAAQSQALGSLLQNEQATLQRIFPLGAKAALLSPTTLLLGLIYFGITVGLSTLGFWLPQAVSSLAANSPSTVGLLTAIPLAFGAAVMIAVSYNSDRTGERVWHFLALSVVASLGWLAFGVLKLPPSARILLICVASGGTYGMQGLFWTLPGTYLSGKAAAPGIALVSALGTTGAFIGPWVIGHLRQSSGDFGAAFSFVAACSIISGVIGLIVGRRIVRRASDAARQPSLSLHSIDCSHD